MARTARTAADRAVTEFETAKAIVDRHAEREQRAAEQLEAFRNRTAERLAVLEQQVTDIRTNTAAHRERLAYAKLNPALPTEYRDTESNIAE